MTRRRAAAIAIVAVLSLSGARAEHQVPGPNGWEEFSSGGGGVVGSYHLREKDGSFHQVVNALVYTNYPTLDAFVTKNAALLKAHSEIRVLGQKRETVCGADPAWEVEYSHPASANAQETTVTYQVVTVKAGYTYIATYLRAITDARRPDAVNWIHAFCKRVG